MSSRTDELLEKLAANIPPFNYARLACCHESAIQTAATAGLVVRPTTTAGITIWNGENVGGKSLIMDRLFTFNLVSTAAQSFFSLWYCMHLEMAKPTADILLLRGTGDGREPDMSVVVDVGRNGAERRLVPGGRRWRNGRGRSPAGGCVISWDCQGRLGRSSTARHQLAGRDQHHERHVHVRRLVVENPTVRIDSMGYGILDARYALVTAPTEEPLTVQDVVDHCQMGEIASDQKATVARYIVAARQMLERRLRRQFVTATWKMYLDYLPSEVVFNDKLPIKTITHVKYYNAQRHADDVDGDHGLPDGPGRRTASCANLAGLRHDVAECDGRHVERGRDPIHGRLRGGVCGAGVHQARDADPRGRCV